MTKEAESLIKNDQPFFMLYTIGFSVFLHCHFPQLTHFQATI